MWKNVGNSTYKLNHYGISWDPTTNTLTPPGLANIRETVQLSADCKVLKGGFSITQYDESGNVISAVSSTLIGYREDINIKLKVLF